MTSLSRFSLSPIARVLVFNSQHVIILEFFNRQWEYGELLVGISRIEGQHDVIGITHHDIHLTPTFAEQATEILVERLLKHVVLCLSIVNLREIGIAGMCLHGFEQLSGLIEFVLAY